MMILYPATHYGAGVSVGGSNCGKVGGGSSGASVLVGCAGIGVFVGCTGTGVKVGGMVAVGMRIFGVADKKRVGGINGIGVGGTTSLKGVLLGWDVLVMNVGVAVLSAPSGVTVIVGVKVVSVSPLSLAGAVPQRTKPRIYSGIVPRMTKKRIVRIKLRRRKIASTESGDARMDILTGFNRAIFSVLPGLLRCQ